MMPRPKAPAWLRESFRDGVDEQAQRTAVPRVKPALAAEGFQSIYCWLAQHDPLKRPCEGRLERFHWINRQRVENALGVLLRIQVYIGSEEDREYLILLAAWDARNGGIGCEAHHRRFDSHATPSLVVPRSSLPAHVEEFTADWGLELELERRFLE